MKTAASVPFGATTLVAALVTLLGGGSPACGSSSDPGAALEAEAVVERRTEGAVTTVRNAAGSQWGGAGTLAEELSIGVLEGDEEYMLGGVSGLWVTEEHVYVADVQVPVVRVYDRDGRWIRDIGQEGQGPGEFRRPRDVAVLPDGTVVVVDGGNRRLVFFDPAGNPQRTWTPEGGHLSGVDVTRDGTLLVRQMLPREDDGSPGVIIPSSALTPVGADGSAGEPRLPPMLGFEADPLVVREGRSTIAFAGNTLFRPDHVWTVRPDGAIVAGVGDEYGFEIHHPDGSVIAVERFPDPVPVHPDEAAYAVEAIEATVHQLAPGWTYDGAVPDTKPAFTSLTADRDDRIWVGRPGEAHRIDDCVENPADDPDTAMQRPCWQSPTLVDLFAPDGTYLGPVDRPADLDFRRTFIAGDEYWAAVVDEAGLVTVRRFRIRPPS
ncbi:MAG: 6-bladed beta-propeller [Acidobacteriota bacterium]